MLVRRIFIVMLGLTYGGVSLKVFLDQGGQLWLAGAVLGGLVGLLGLALVVQALRKGRDAGMPETDGTAEAVETASQAEPAAAAGGEASAISAVRARLMARGSVEGLPPATAPEPAEPPASPEPVLSPPEPATRPARLRDEPGFPWVPRFIGIWSREAIGDAPEDLRELVAHWIRWADSRPDDEVIMAEAAAEFALLIDNWPWDEIPGASADATFRLVARRLVAEGDEEPGLAAMLPDAIYSAARD